MITITLTYPDAESAAYDLAKLASQAQPVALGKPESVDLEALRIPTPAAKVETVKAIEKAAKVEAPKPAKAVAPPAPIPTATETATATPPVEPAPSEPASASPSDAPLTYEVVGPAITKAAAVDKTRVVAALAKFGAKRGPDLKFEDYAAFMKEIA